MAVYERSWRRYQGSLTGLRWRFLVVTAYALRDAFASRLFTAFYVACALPSLIALFFVYLTHNLGLLEQIGLTPESLGRLTVTWFRVLFAWQAVPAFFVAVIVSPSLVAADLANGGLPLYLSRPLNRAEYVAGKMAVLGILLSPLTWIAGLLVFGLQAYLEPGAWWQENLRIGVAFLVGHLVWIVVVSLLSLAISAWVRYKPLARGALVGLFLVLGALSEMVNGITDTSWGDLTDLSQSLYVVVARLFDPAATLPVPVAAAAASLAGFAAGSVLLLNRKLRAHEVVR